MPSNKFHKHMAFPCSGLVGYGATKALSPKHDVINKENSKHPALKLFQCC
ncbi:hypothetical protein TNCV_4699231 [Trichonephila clavipes]|nr:hypothetical protein TNCV_4699231 [Trichonephila clavipes]